MPSADKYTDPKLREQVKQGVQESDKGGAPGQWSARKAQFMASEYKKRGGGYNDPGKKDESQKNLTRWGEEEWQTQEGSGNAKQQDGSRKRYLPKEVWKNMTEEEKKKTEELKQTQSRKGQQFVPNTQGAKEQRKLASKSNREKQDNDDSENNEDEDAKEDEEDEDEDYEQGEESEDEQEHGTDIGAGKNSSPSQAIGSNKKSSGKQSDGKTQKSNGPKKAGKEKGDGNGRAHENEEEDIEENEDEIKEEVEDEDEDDAEYTEEQEEVDDAGSESQQKCRPSDEKRAYGKQRQGQQKKQKTK